MRYSWKNRGRYSWVAGVKANRADFLCATGPLGIVSKGYFTNILQRPVDARLVVCGSERAQRLVMTIRTTDLV